MTPSAPSRTLSYGISTNVILTTKNTTPRHLQEERRGVQPASKIARETTAMEPGCLFLAVWPLVGGISRAFSSVPWHAVVDRRHYSTTRRDAARLKGLVSAISVGFMLQGVRSRYAPTYLWLARPRAIFLPPTRAQIFLTNARYSRTPQSCFRLVPPAANLQVL